MSEEHHRTSKKDNDRPGQVRPHKIEGRPSTNDGHEEREHQNTCCYESEPYH